MNEPLKKILADTLGIAETKICEDAAAQNIPTWDSVAHLNIVLSLEAAYGVSFTPEEITEITSLEKIRAALAKHGVAVAHME